MRAFLRRWQWQFLGIAALTLILVGLIPVVSDPDGSGAFLSKVQPGMTLEEAEVMLARSRFDTRGMSIVRLQPSATFC
jgi:hypothetical protein